jgi:hypothetical protein
MSCDREKSSDAAQFGDQPLDDALVGSGKALLLGEAAQARNFAEQGDTMHGFAINLIPFGKDMGDVRLFAVYLFVGVAIILHNMLGREGRVVFVLSCVHGHGCVYTRMTIIWDKETVM